MLTLPDSTDTIHVSLRSARAEDWPAIERLLDETWHVSYNHILGRIRVRLGLRALSSLKPLLGQSQLAATFPIVVAQIEEQIVGLANAQSSRCGKGAMLWMLYILPSHQHMGIGELLLENVLARVPGTSFAKLQVLPGNHGAIRFYERMGFKKMQYSFHLSTCTRVLNMQRTFEA